MTDHDQRALAIIKQHGPLSCTVLGDHLFADSERRAKRQSWARPAGKVIARLVKAGLVHRDFNERFKRMSPQYAATGVDQ